MALTTTALVIVTGAGRGIGKEIALQLADQVSQGSIFLLLSRAARGLKTVKELISEKSVFQTELFTIDFGEGDLVLDSIGDFVRDHVASVDSVIIVHNAGSVGNVGETADKLNDRLDWQNYLQVNLVSTILLNNLILQNVPQKEKKVYVINLTSLLAVQAFPSFSQYSVGKAAREAYFRSLALENKDVKVLSYSPGPVDTDMRGEIARRSYSDDIRAAFSSTNTSDVSRAVLTPAQTVEKLVGILKEDKYESGARIDYFDV